MQEYPERMEVDEKDLTLIFYFYLRVSIRRTRLLVNAHGAKVKRWMTRLNIEVSGNLTLTAIREHLLVDLYTVNAHRMHTVHNASPRFPLLELRFQIPLPSPFQTFMKFK